jgi:hypothetical protein
VLEAVVVVLEAVVVVLAADVVVDVVVDVVGVAAPAPAVPETAVPVDDEVPDGAGEGETIAGEEVVDVVDVADDAVVDVGSLVAGVAASLGLPAANGFRGIRDLRRRTGTTTVLGLLVLDGTVTPGGTGPAAPLACVVPLSSIIGTPTRAASSSATSGHIRRSIRSLRSARITTLRSSCRPRPGREADRWTR